MINDVDHQNLPEPKISNGSSRSVLVKMKEAGYIERIGPGKYQITES